MILVDPKLNSPEHTHADTIAYAEAAALLGIAVGTLYAWVHQRRIPHYRIGPRCVRFSRSELLHFLQDHAIAAELVSADSRTAAG